jgi:THO complex subunit 5
MLASLMSTLLLPPSYTPVTANQHISHKYQSLPLIPESEFLNHHPEYSELSPHELMIKRIEHEYAERQALEEKRQGLLKKKQGLIAANNKRKEALASLDKDLEKFIEAAGPIEKTFEKGLGA